MRNLSFMQFMRPLRNEAFLLLILFPGALIIAQHRAVGRYGMLIMAGGRYDDMRMCVATPAGVKGGPVADIMLSGRYTILQDRTFGFNLPLMRPVLFGLAFKMLQFEPEVFLEFENYLNENLTFNSSPSLGVSFHYGPDYKSDRKFRSPSFFAAGPIAGCHIGLGFQDGNGKRKMIGIRPFYAILFSKRNGTGNVIGAAFEYQHR